jgi:hypothetical protein
MRSRHIALNYHYAREQVMHFKRFALKYIKSQDNPADIFTKPLDRETLCKHRDFIFNLKAHSSTKQGRRDDHEKKMNKKAKYD